MGNLTTPFKAAVSAYIAHFLVSKLGMPDAEASAASDAAWVFLTGFLTYAVPATWGSGLAAKLLAFALRMKSVVPFAVLAVAMGGCSAARSGGVPAPLVRDCQLAQVVYAGLSPILAAKCAQAEEPLLDKHCIASIAAQTAIEACFVAADAGDVDGVRNSIGNLGEVQEATTR